MAASHTGFCSWAGPGRWRVRPQGIRGVRGLSQITALVRPTRRNPVFYLQGRYQLHPSTLTALAGALISADPKLHAAWGGDGSGGWGLSDLVGTSIGLGTCVPNKFPSRF